MKRNNYNCVIVQDKITLKKALIDIYNNGLISFDAETSGLDQWAPGAYLTSVGIGTEKYDWCFPLQHTRGKLYNDFEGQAEIIRKLNNIVPKKKIIGHNGKFDHLWIRVLFGYEWPIYFDTMLADYNLDENRRHGLKEVALREKLDKEDYDIPLSAKHGLTHSLTLHCKYLAKDIFFTRKLYFKYKKELKRDKGTNDVFWNITMPAASMYCDAEFQGVYINDKALQEGKAYWRERAKQSREKLDSLYPSNNRWKNKQTKQFEQGVNWGSPQQLAEILFEKEGLNPLDKTPAGAYSTSESVLLRLSKDHEIPKLVLDYREAIKNLNTFIEAWERQADPKSRIHPSFKIHGTVTGRPSCVDPNLQQVPRNPQIRSIITAPPGWVLLDVDYSQAELRIAAEMSNDQKLSFAYQTGLDVHSMTVENVFGIPADKQTKEQRKKGKAINFGFLYGMFWKKFKLYARDNYGVEFTDEESEEVMNSFFRLYTGLKPWHKTQKRFAELEGYVRSIIGRMRRLPDAMIDPEGKYDARKEEALRQAINSPVQSFASDLTLMSAIEIHNTFDREYLRIVGSVHDSILMECKSSKVDYVAPRILKIMKRPKLLDKLHIRLSVPLEGELEVGPWGAGKVWQAKK